MSYGNITTEYTQLTWVDADEPGFDLTIIVSDDYRLDMVARTDESWEGRAVLTIDRNVDGDPVPVYQWEMDYWLANRLCGLLCYMESDMDVPHFGFYDIADVINKSIDFAIATLDRDLSPLVEIDLDLDVVIR